ncbi:predicted protein [Plenodomus lingam JN3]|uniref:Predicted protein n=1 Tax=Leptosphaeria maculans (strain JN3 / isolate v23.1.3 / race Av1-4-5-6-7-8) TaxID=985895 RepID=E5A966_LEPMJ|nr:predicted protein [Plenodomus lingam JN3]CBY00207.1 predicted protein [Plenodomus lingam JN3]
MYNRQPCHAHVPEVCDMDATEEGPGAQDDGASPKAAHVLLSCLLAVSTCIEEAKSSFAVGGACVGISVKEALYTFHLILSHDG